MNNFTKVVLVLFVLAVFAAGFFPAGEQEEKQPSPKEKLEKELLKRGIVLEDYYTTTVAQLEEALGIDIKADGGERVGFVMLRSPVQDEEEVFKQAAAAVASVFPDVGAVAMLRIDAEPKVLVFAPVGAGYADAQRLPLDVAKLLDRDARAERIASAIEGAGIEVQRAYVLSAEEARKISPNLSASGDVALLALVLRDGEFPDKLLEAMGVAFEVDSGISAVLAGNMLAKKGDSVTFYYITRQEYEKGALRLEELLKLEMPVG